ncbi:MAG: OB-fold nucleic acid binding domain-containing protein [Promethearchaeota archaeon]
MISNSTQRYKKETAYKLSIIDIVNGKFVKVENKSFVITPFGLNINRARIFGIIVDKRIFIQNQRENIEDVKKDYGYFIIDDGTETIRIKVWGDDIEKHNLEDLNIGETVDIIGRVREYNEEIFIMPEIINKIEDPNWELLRELEIIELKKLYKTKKIVNTLISPNKLEENISNNIIIDEKILNKSDFDELEIIKIKDLNPTSKKVNLIGRCIEMGEIRQTKNDNRVMDALLADETGCVTLTIWNEDIDKMKEGESYLIHNGYMSSFREKLSLNIGKYGKFTISEEKIKEVNKENNISNKEF